MKTNKKSFIFALLLGVSILGVAKDAEAVDKKKEIKEETLVANVSAAKLGAYIGTVLPQYKNQENWSIIEEVVTLYNQQPSKIRTISKEASSGFELAVSELNRKLVLLNSDEALQWKADLGKTAGAVRFIRNFDINSIAAESIEITALEAPVSAAGL